MVICDCENNDSQLIPLHPQSAQLTNYYGLLFYISNQPEPSLELSQQLVPPSLQPPPVRPKQLFISAQNGSKRRPGQKSDKLSEDQCDASDLQTRYLTVGYMRE